MTTDGSACPTCGRERWQGDRFCATCGNDFGETSADAGVIDVDHLTARTTDTAPQRSNWRDALKGLGALGAIVLLLVGGLYLASRGDSTTDEAGSDDTTELEGDDNESDDAERDDTAPDEADEDEPPVDDENVTPVPETPEPTPRPTPAPTPSPLLELLDTSDVGARYMLTSSTRGVVAHDLETGDVHTAWSAVANGSMGDEHLVLSDGLIEPLFPYDDTKTPKFVPWDPDQQVTELPGSFVAAYMDPGVGRVVVLTLEGVSTELVAVAVESGEQRTVPVDPSLRESGFGWWILSIADAAQAPFFIVSMQDETWGWDWDSGWNRLMEGHMQQVGADFMVVRECSTPEVCAFSATDYSGETIIDSVPWGVEVWSSLSPDARTAATLSPPGTVGFGPTAELTLTDLASGDEAVFEVNAGFPGLRWSPNGRYLIVLGYEDVTLIDARTRTMIGEVRTGSSPNPFLSPTFTDEFVVAEP